MMTKIYPDCDATVLSTSQPDNATTDLTPEHKLLCDVAAVKVHLDKYSRIEQRALLGRVMDHLNAVVETQRVAASKPNRIGTTAEMQKMYDRFGGNWPKEEIEPGRFVDVDPEVLRAALAATPAVGGEREASMKLVVALSFADHPRPHPSIEAPADTKEELYEALRVVAAAYRLAAQPASPLRGREAIARIIDPDFWSLSDFSYPERAKALRESSLKKADAILALSASPPEQPAADPVTGLELLASAWMHGHSRARGITFEEMAADIGKGSFLWGQAMMDAVALSPTAPDKDAAPHYPSFAERNLIDRFGRKDRK